MRNHIAILAAASLGTISISPAQENVFSASKDKILTLDAGESATSVQIVVRGTDSGATYYYGEFESGKRVNTIDTSGYDDAGKEVKFPLTVRLGDDAITVIADFPKVLDATADPSGTYNKLTPAQHLALVREGYRGADEALNARWSEFKKSLPADVMADLTGRQRSWIEHKESMSRWNSGDGYKSSPNYWTSAWDMTVSRLYFLDNYTAKDIPPGIAGVYVDEYGGSIDILDAGAGTYDFQIEVVRGPTYHLGGITKKVAIAAGKGRFVDTDKEAFWDDKPCTIEFSFSGNRLELKCENTAYYHGARAYFDGTYFKTKGTPSIDDER